jgi:hypothetical protein
MKEHMMVVLAVSETPKTASNEAVFGISLTGSTYNAVII